MIWPVLVMDPIEPGAEERKGPRAGMDRASVDDRADRARIRSPIWAPWMLTAREVVERADHGRVDARQIRAADRSAVAQRRDVPELERKAARAGRAAGKPSKPPAPPLIVPLLLSVVIVPEFEMPAPPNTARAKLGARAAAAAGDLSNIAQRRDRGLAFATPAPPAPPVMPRPPWPPATDPELLSLTIVPLFATPAPPAPPELPPKPPRIEPELLRPLPETLAEPIAPRYSPSLRRLRRRAWRRWRHVRRQLYRVAQRRDRAGVQNAGPTRAAHGAGSAISAADRSTLQIAERSDCRAHGVRHGGAARGPDARANAHGAFAALPAADGARVEHVAMVPEFETPAPPAPPEAAAPADPSPKPPWPPLIVPPVLLTSAPIMAPWPFATPAPAALPLTPVPPWPPPIVPLLVSVVIVPPFPLNTPEPPCRGCRRRPCRRQLFHRW